MSILTDDAVPFSKIYRQIISKGVVTGFSEQVADGAIQNAINSISEKTNAMRQWITLDMQEGEQLYPIGHFFDESFMPLRLMRAKILGNEVEIGEEFDELDARMDDDGSWVEICRLPCARIKPGLENEFMTSVSNEDVLDACPESMYQIDLLIAMCAGPFLCAVPKAFYHKFWQEIAIGAAADMLEMPRLPWTDQRLGAIRRDEFRRALKRLRTDAMLDYTARHATMDRRGWGMLSRRGQRGFA